MADTDLSKVLNECCEAARSGYELASEEKGALDGILSSAGEKIRETAVEYKASPCEVIGIGETLEDQLAFAIKTAPKLTIQGGTTEVLRGIIARGLGLR